MKINVYYCLTIMLTALLLSGCQNDESARENMGGMVTPAVEAVEARFGALPLEERLSGVVRAQNQVDIYPRISAPVEEIYVQDGQQVEQGDPLVRLRDTDYRERLRQAEANLRITLAQQRQAEASLGEVESEMRRQRILAERELTSELEMEQIEAQLESAEASLELARAQVEQARSNVEEEKDALGQTVIRAPVSGTAGQRNAEVGMLVNTSTRLFTVGNLEDSKITVNLTERMLGYVRVGQTVEVRSENMGDRVLTGEISRISPFLGERSFSTTAEIDINNEEQLLIPGMFVSVSVLYGESEETTIIPLSALYRNTRTGETGVYVASSFGVESEMLEELENEGGSGQLSNPTDVEFIPVDVVAQGRHTAGVNGIQSGQWVVAIGQHLLERSQEEVARVRPMSWDRIMRMQDLQPQDLLREIMSEDQSESSI